ncbi:MAG: cyclic nucleotide-binding domain-containing protein [Anaerolineae bacterium]
MLNQFARLFNVRRDEIRRLAIFSVMTIFFIVGYVWANITIIADFLASIDQDNNQNIAFLLIGDAIIIVVTFAIYSAFADRWANHHIMAGLALVGIIGIVIGVILLNSNIQPAFIPSLFLYLVFRSVGEAISTHWGPLINDYFDTRAAKRIFTILGGVTRLSYVIGALLLTLANTSINSEGQLIRLGLVIWLITLLGMFLISTMMPRLMKLAPVRPSSTMVQNRKGYLQNLIEGYRFAFKSRYLRAFVIASVLMMILLALMQFEILAGLSNIYVGAESSVEVAERQISDFLSQITLIGSLILLPFQFFVFNRLVSWAGVETMNLVFPTTSLISVLALASIPLLPDGASLQILQFSIPILIIVVTIAEFNRTILNIGIRAINDEFLYNAVPVRVKGRTRGFISGIVEPFGTLLAGFIILIPAVESTTWAIPALLLTVGVAYLLASIWVSQQYGVALISMIEEENFSFLLEANNRIAIDSDTLQSLETRFKQAPDDDTRLLMARLLIEARGAEYADLLITRADSGSKYLRAGIIDTFVSSDLRLPRVIDMCIKYIVDSDPTVRKSAITGLKQLVGVESEQYLLAALELLNDNSPSLVAEVLPDLIHTRDFYFLQHATQTLNEMLESNDPQQRAIGVNILGDTNSPRVLLLLLRYLIDRSQVVRLQSVLAIERLASSVKVTEELVQALSMTVSSLLRDPLDRIRVSAVNIIANLHPTDFVERIMPALLDDNLEVRETAVKWLIITPNETTKTLASLAESEHGLMARMATSVLVRINKKYETRIYQHMDTVLSKIYLNINRVRALEPLTHYPIIEIIQNILAEENQQWLDEVFYLLGSVHGMENVEITVEAIHSPIPRTRANGIEALDVMLNQHLLTAIETLTNPDSTIVELSDYGTMTYKLRSFTAIQILRELLDKQNEDWRVYIGIEALGEMGKRLYQTQNKPRQASPLDLLADLSSSDQPKTDDTLPENDIPFTLVEIEQLLSQVPDNLPMALRTALRKTRHAIQGVKFERSDQSISDVISEVERIIFLKRVQFFQDVTINQLRKVANVCQEVWFDAEQIIFSEGDFGGQLFVIVEGRVGIEQVQDDGKSARLNTLGIESSFGEDMLFDESRHTTTAIALTRTLVLRLDNDALMSLIQSYPEMSMKIIRVLSQQIRAIDHRITSMARQEGQAESLFDKLEL